MYLYCIHGHKYTTSLYQIIKPKLILENCISYKCFVGDWRTSAVAAEPPNSSRVYGPEAGTGHQAVPPHWEGQAGILSTVCHIAGGELTRTWIYPVLCINPVKNTVFSHCDFSYTGHPLASCIYHIVSDKQRHETIFISLKKNKQTTEQRHRVQNRSGAFYKGKGEDGKTEEFKAL